MTRCVLIALALLLLPAPAFGDGAPVIGVDAGSTGVTARGVPDRYVAMHSLHGTTIARIQRDGGRVVVSRHFPRGLVIPTVAYDRTATGLSADGSRLVGVRPLHRRTGAHRAGDQAAEAPRDHFAARPVHARRPLARRGLLFLLQTLSEARYAVRAYHVGARELLPKPIVDPSEPDEPMTGMPLTRTTSRDGRWAYTLYDSPGHPFIHALDTEEATARCIDLHALAGRDDLLAMRLTVGRDGTIAIRRAERSDPLLEIEPAGSPSASHAPPQPRRRNPRAAGRSSSRASPR